MPHGNFLVGKTVQKFYQEEATWLLRDMEISPKKAHTARFLQVCGTLFGIRRKFSAPNVRAPQWHITIRFCLALSGHSKGRGDSNAPRADLFGERAKRRRLHGNILSGIFKEKKATSPHLLGFGFQPQPPLFPSPIRRGEEGM